MSLSTRLIYRDGTARKANATSSKTRGTTSSSAEGPTILLLFPKQSSEVIWPRSKSNLWRDWLISEFTSQVSETYPGQQGWKMAEQHNLLSCSPNKYLPHSTLSIHLTFWIEAWKTNIEDIRSGKIKFVEFNCFVCTCVKSTEILRGHCQLRYKTLGPER